MVSLIASQDLYFKTPQKIKIADKVYEDVVSHNQREIIDNDGVRKTVNYLGGKESDYIAYVVNNKVTRAEENYFRPQTMKLGDKVYKGIVSKVTIPGRYDVYSINRGDGFHNQVRVKSNGSALDIAAIQNKMLLRKIKQPFLKLFKNIA